MNQEIDIQRNYYAQTALEYDKMHLEGDPEQIMALHLLTSYIEFYKIRTILDVGAGTGRTILWLKNRFPDIVITGIEPVKALREQGHKKGIPENVLIDGDGYNIAFPDNSFEMVCEFATLHHVREPHKMVSEMSRVASKMVCISDCNFMGQGPSLLRLVKYTIFSLGLWKLADWFKTKGKGYTISEGDGLAYSYSVYQDLPLLQAKWDKVRLMTTGGDGGGTKKPQKLSAAFLFIVALDKKK